MCGIAGIYGIKDTQNGETIVLRMINALAHRGPDDEGIYVDNSVVLGHKRLAIIDLSAAGHQPMSTKDGRYTIVYNGELYNYKDIKKSLSDYPFQTQSDTEVILAGWQKWGKEGLEQFNGMFAFAIWDNKEKELFIAMDKSLKRKKENYDLWIISYE